MGVGSVFEDFTELLGGLALAVAAGAILWVLVINPVLNDVTSILGNSYDRSVRYSLTLGSVDEVHDQEVHRMPGVDPVVGFTRSDSGLSKMYFRPEQFIMLPIVDTDPTVNPFVTAGRRTVSIVANYRGPVPAGFPQDYYGWTLNGTTSNLLFYMNYPVTADTIYDKTNVITSLASLNLMSNVFGLANDFTSSAWGTQAGGATQQFGGYNITLDSATQAGALGNSVFFVNGRVPSK